MRDYMVCWRGDLDNGFQEDFFVAGSNPIYTYNLVRADNMYDAVDIFWKIRWTMPTMMNLFF